MDFAHYQKKIILFIVTQNASKRYEIGIKYNDKDLNWLLESNNIK